MDGKIQSAMVLVCTTMHTLLACYPQSHTTCIAKIIQNRNCQTLIQSVLHRDNILKVNLNIIYFVQCLAYYLLC